MTVSGLYTPSDEKKKHSQENFTTVVFYHENEAQRQELMSLVHSKWNAEGSLRVTALSADHEMTRINLIEEALEREDVFDLKDTIEDICQCPDVSNWDWEAPPHD